MINNIKLSPMETAPKDGEEFLVSCDSGYISVYWDEDFRKICWSFDNSFVSDDFLKRTIGWWRLGNVEVV